MFKTLLICLVSLLVLSSQAIADTMYNVNGDVTLAGNNSCPSCTETVNFSFDIDYTFGFSMPGGVDVYNVSAADVTATWLGNLASAAGASIPLINLGSESIVPLLDASGDEVDVYLNQGSPIDSTPPPAVIGADLYGCATQTCINDFVSPGSWTYSSPPPVSGIFAPATFSNVTVTAVPEPSTILLLACGLLALGPLLYEQSRFEFRKSHPSLELIRQEQRS